MPLALRLAFLLLLAAPAFAQDADRDLSAVVESPALSWSQAVWLVGNSTGAFDVGLDAAAGEAERLGWGTDAGTTVDLAGYSQLLLKALSLPHGLFYGLFPSPRYAVRELVFLRLVPNAAPDSVVTGTQALTYLQAAQAWKEAHP